MRSTAGAKVTKKHVFEASCPTRERRWRETDSPVVREELARGRARHAHLPGMRRWSCGCGARHAMCAVGEAPVRAIYEVSRATLA